VAGVDRAPLEAQPDVGAGVLRRVLHGAVKGGLAVGAAGLRLAVAHDADDAVGQLAVAVDRAGVVEGALPGVADVAVGTLDGGLRPGERALVNAVDEAAERVVAIQRARGALHDFVAVDKLSLLLDAAAGQAIKDVEGISPRLDAAQGHGVDRDGGGRAHAADETQRVVGVGRADIVHQLAVHRDDGHGHVENGQIDPGTADRLGGTVADGRGAGDAPGIEDNYLVVRRRLGGGGGNSLTKQCASAKKGSHDRAETERMTGARRNDFV